jgi:[ribosomal protein S18]-alanine N-acetyltransferase
VDETEADILIRPVVPSDLKEICVIDHESFPTPWSEESYLSEIDRAGMVFLTAIHKNEVVGFVTAFSVVDEGHIMKML